MLGIVKADPGGREGGLARRSGASLSGRCTAVDGERNDVHNCHVDEAAAQLGQCGFTDLRTGNMCLGRARHRGPCSLAAPHFPARPEDQETF